MRRSPQLARLGLVALLVGSIVETAPVRGADPVPAAAATSPEPATHAESKRVVLRDAAAGRTLQTFCLGPDGRVFALVAASVDYGVGDGAAAKAGGEIRVLDPTGVEQAKWSVDFTPERIAASPDGRVYVGGNGRLACYTAEGKRLSECESPHLAAVLADPEALRRQAEEQRKSMIDSYRENVKQFEEQVKRLEEAARDEAKREPAKDKSSDQPKDAADGASSTKRSSSSILGAFFAIGSHGDVGEPNAAQQLQNLRQAIGMYRRILDMHEKKTVDDVVREITARLQRIHGIAVSGNDVFVATGVAKGYGYAVWRLSRDFAEPKQIVNGLSGCCGQLDIQAKGDELFVAENSRHRVVRYDRDGKQLAAWGKRDREGAGAGFGGCCNPMNLCFTADGGVVTAESEGRVKCFHGDGTFDRVLADAKVGGGCKNVAVAVSPDGKQVYFYDQQGSQIIILDRNDSAAPKPAAKANQVGQRS